MMLNRLRAATLVLGLAISPFYCPVSLAAHSTHAVPVPVHTVLHHPPATTDGDWRIVGSTKDSKEVKELLAVFDDMVAASDQHHIEDILKHYNPQFISGDNLTLQQLKNMILETWKEYPDIAYKSDIQEIRINKDWATVETLDHSVSSVPAEKDIINVPGKMSSESRSLLFFRHVGDTWEVTSDATLWEDAIIRRGVGEDVKVTLSAPEQVKAGTTYSAEVEAALPEGTFSLVTIDNEPLIYPKPEVEEKLRTLGGDSNELQRVMKANATNHNEIVVATLALTSIEQSNPDRPSLMVNGIISIVKRVNVVPISVEEMQIAQQGQEIIKTSASGKINADTVEKSAPSGVPDLNVPPVSSPSDDQTKPKKDEDNSD